MSQGHRIVPVTRRGLLRRGLASAGTLAVLRPWEALLGRVARGAPVPSADGYGPLEPVEDETTGLPLVALPRGFRYLTYGWARDPMSDGRKTPYSHDGMAVVKAEGDLVWLVRNHEDKRDTQSFADAAHTYDPRAAGGTTNLVFNVRTGRFERSWASLGGTVKNCAGGPTPWGSWLSCEETVLGPGDFEDESKSHPGQKSNDAAGAAPTGGGKQPKSKSGDKSKKQPADDANPSAAPAEPRRVNFTKTHGWIFDVPADGQAEPVPLEGLGRFVHEAVAVDPRSGIVYETQDASHAGFYRFVPRTPGQLAQGGALEMLRAPGHPDLRKGIAVGAELDVEWVPIADPTRPHTRASERDGRGVFDQGAERGGSRFIRLEGCWYHDGAVYIVSTSGGDAGAGQIWQYTPARERLRLVFQSPGKQVLDMPDNITLSPHGGMVLCEDGDYAPQRLHALTLAGQLVTLAENHVVLHGEKHGLKGDYRANEWCGATFSPDGQWLFVNMQTPGLTLAITGPWDRGPLS